MVVHEYANEKGKWHVFPYSENLIQCVANFFLGGEIFDFGFYQW